MESLATRGKPQRGPQSRARRSHRSNTSRKRSDRSRLIKRLAKRNRLSSANSSEAILWNTDLTDADLSSATFHSTKIEMTKLTRAFLGRASFWFTIFDGATLTGANFTKASMREARFTNTDLSAAIALDTVDHLGPSSIDLDTFYKSKGNIPEQFLRGCGVPNNFITYARSLSTNPVEYYSCFISHSSTDKEFAQRLYSDLQAAGVRCWYAPEDLKIGDKFRMRIEESIRLYDKLLLILSKNSIESAWVEEEVETALERERQHKEKLVLFPVRLDNSVMETKQAWAGSLRRIRHIGDFSKWKNHDLYQKAFNRLLRDLNSQTKTAPPL